MVIERIAHVTRNDYLSDLALMEWTICRRGATGLPAELDRRQTIVVGKNVAVMSAFPCILIKIHCSLGYLLM